jgi:MFS family permease
MKIAAGFTQGDSDYLFVGRNGVFYDRGGRDWDVTITRIADSPISIRQSFFAPYKKVATFVESQFAKFASSKEQAVQGGLNAAVAAPASPPAAPTHAFDIAKFAGIFAAFGLAIGAIGGAVASVFSGLLRLALWEWPLAVAAALLLISGPSMLLAALKLRQRNLGPLLEGTGWAVNGRVKINMPLGVALTDRGVLPPNSDRLAFDPYEDEAANTRRSIAFALSVAVLAWLAAAKVFHFWPF